jgi:hypothetical protein
MWGRSGVGNAVLMVAWILAGTSCAGDDQGPSETPMVIEKSPVKSGDEQTGPVGLALGNQLQVLVTREGVPQSGIQVSWSTSFGGEVSPGSAPTNEEGLSATTWTLGPEVGTQAATASVAGATGSPLTFTALATDAEVPPTGIRVGIARQSR